MAFHCKHNITYNIHSHIQHGLIVQHTTIDNVGFLTKRISDIGPKIF
jgi:hypothetical protein